MTDNILKLTKSITVEDENTALKVGSGGMPVLATPEIIRLVENIAYLGVADILDESQTTVGGYIDINHLKPTLTGITIQIEVNLTEIVDKKMTFEYKVLESGLTIAKGKHIRYVVNKEQFLLKARPL